MIKVEWRLGEFNVCFAGRYSDLYQVEKDIDILCGSNDFGGFGGEEWFLINKNTKSLEFMLLSVPAAIDELDDYSHICLLQENETWLEEFYKDENHQFPEQRNAFFSMNENKLLVCSLENRVENKYKIADDFYLLLDKKGIYCGFLLNNATNHISSNSNVFDDEKFKVCLAKMLFFCRNEIYDAMDIQEARYLVMLEELEKECLLLHGKDGRIENVLQFVKNAKFTFFDIDFDS